MKRIRSRTAEKQWRHRFPHYKPMGIFFRRSRAANSVVGGRIRSKFDLRRALMHVFTSCKYEKDQMKNNREKMETPFFPIITLSVTMETSGWIWPNFNLIKTLLYAIITWKYQKIRSRTAEKKWIHYFSHYKPMFFYQTFKGS